MLALLSQRTSVLTEGTSSHLSPEEEDVVNEAFDVLYENLPIRMSVEEHTSLGMSGHSYFGLAYAHSIYTDFVEHRKGVAVLVSGTVDSNYSGMDDAAYVMNEYLDSMDDGKGSGTLWTLDFDLLSENVKGDFVALIYDRAGDRLVLLSGEGDNNRSLFWGLHREYGDSVIMLSDDGGLLEALCQPNEVHAFPSNHMCVVSADIFKVVPISCTHTKKRKKNILNKVESANNMYV